LLPWLAGLALLAGIVAVLVAVVPNTNGDTGSGPTSRVVRPQTAPATVPLSKDARRVAGRFILTAVVRKHLDEAWKLAGAPMRGGLTYRQWLTGSIPVIPYNAPLALAPMKIDHSYRDYALLEVALLPPQKSRAEGEYFWMELKRIGRGADAHWVVWSWAPRVNAGVWSTPGN
jgi:hypothetical protein